MPAYGGKSDSSGLGKLHVYGDLLKLYSLPVRATIMQVGELHEELQALERQMLTLYASYVLAHSGFYVEAWVSEDFVASGGEVDYTTKYKDDDWFEAALAEYFDPGAMAFYFDWEMDYANERQERLRVIFVNRFISEISPSGITSDEAECLLRKFDKSCSNYVLVHPKLSRQDKKGFMKVKERMKQIVGQDLVLSTGEFVAKFIPDNEKRHIIEENWKSLRKKIVQKLQQKKPILIFATHEQQLSDVDGRIRDSRIKYQTHSFEDAIKDAGVACESLLQILHSVYVSKKIEKDLDFYDLLCTLRDVLTEEFGSNIYQDLDFVRIWRNNVVHPGREKPDGAITLQVITKAKLFNELFKKKIF